MEKELAFLLLNNLQTGLKFLGINIEELSEPCNTRGGIRRFALGRDDYDVIGSYMLFLFIYLFFFFFYPAIWMTLMTPLGTPLMSPHEFTVLSSPFVVKGNGLIHLYLH